METEILVVPRDGLAPALHASRAAVPAASFAEACALLGVEGARWLRRSSAERDPSWKQVIPYVTLFNGEGLALAYPRQGRETRLHRLWSLGIGGHVERDDAPPGIAWPAVLRASAAREVAEEYPAGWAGDLVLLGVISEEETEVGRVHVGLCCALEVDPATHRGGDGELEGHRWVGPDRPLDGLPEGVRLEIWSELALPLLRGRAP